MIYTDNDIEYLGPIRPSVVCDETTQDNDMTNLPHVGYTEK